MSLKVDIAKTVQSAGRRFHLRVAFETAARRTVIYGPSGAGKSLTLKAIAGLLAPDTGHIAFDGETLFDHAALIDMPARRRGFGYLFQDYALFPKLTVRQNIAFGLRAGWRNPSLESDDEATARWLHAFKLDEVAAQRPHTLSGGQRQRTALARALAPAPRALLLDEPFAALDPELRGHLRAELDALLQRIGIPVLMITHDPEDRAWFGDQVIHLREGVIVDAVAVSPPAVAMRQV
jgi:molybdate transport system ATP-binding protein